MAKRRHKITEETFQRLVKEGRGQGSGLFYLAWILIHDFSSRGRVHRPRGMTIGRVYQLFSDGEYYLFVMYDWDLTVIDIREQFPLDRDLSYRIARALGLRHPMTTDGTPWPLTTDFLFTVSTPDGPKLKARTFKPSEELKNRRVREKLEIERRYWLAQGVDWAIATEKDLDHVLFRNVETVSGFHDLTGFWEPYPGCLFDLGQDVLDRIRTGWRTEYTLAELCRSVAKDQHRDPELVWTATRNLIAHRYLCTDMHDPMALEQRPLAWYVPNDPEVK